MRIRTKLLVFFLPLALLSVGVMSQLARTGVRAILEQEVEKRGISIVTGTAENPGMAAGFREGDERQLLAPLQSVLENTRALYAMALDDSGRVLAHTNVAEKGKVYTDAATVSALRSAHPVSARLEVAGRPVLDISYPVWDVSRAGSGEEFLLLGEEDAAERPRLGTVRLGLPLGEALETSERISTQVFWAIIGGGGLALGLALLFIRKILYPVGLLAETTERMARGELGETVPVLSSDEIGDLARSFNQMSRDLAETTVSKDFLDSIQRNMLDVLIVTAPDGSIGMLNQSALDLLNYSEAELVGRPVDLLFAGAEDSSEWEAHKERIQEDIVRNLEESLLSKDGRRIPVLFSASAFKDKGDRTAGVIITARDITERKQAEEALQSAYGELEQRVEERTAELQRINESLMREMTERRNLEDQLRQSQKMDAVGRLAGGVAHDFNNQLAVIRGYVEMSLEDYAEDSPIHQDLVQIEKAVRRSASLTDQLLMFSSNQPVNMETLDLNSEVGDLQKMLGRLLGAAVEVHLDLADDLWRVNADSGNIDQVITNLALNARDAMPEGGTIAIQTRNVEVDDAFCQQFSDARPGRFVRLNVSDTGTGMDEEVRSRLFEPFFTTKAPGKGTGLGLAVVYGIVQAHEGWITVESQPGRGSRFEIYLPALDREAEAAEGDLQPASSDQFRGEGERVLLVEDEPSLREVTRRTLVERGYVVQTAGTVAEATEAFRRGDPPFDLILCDVVLPDGRGPDLVFELLREQPGVAAILVTGYTDDRTDWERVDKAGLALLQKPVPMAVLLEQMRRALGKREA